MASIARYNKTSGCNVLASVAPKSVEFVPDTHQWRSGKMYQLGKGQLLAHFSDRIARHFANKKNDTDQMHPE
jgi:hypothetical protein